MHSSIVRIKWFYALFSALFVVGCIAYAFYQASPQDRRYPITRAHAVALLDKSVAPVEIMGDHPLVVSRSTEDEHRVIWKISAKGQEVMRFTADLSEPDPGSTTVKIDVKGATGGAFGDIDKRLSDNSSIKKLYLMALEEKIAAMLEGRAPNLDRVLTGAAIATVTNFGAINAQFDRAAAQYAKEDRENIERAYAAKGGLYAR
jgi:hypothetical protein